MRTFVIGLLSTIALAGCSGGGTGSGGTDNQAVCGDGVCSAGESSTTCCTDCTCGAGATCEKNQCVAAPTCHNSGDSCVVSKDCCGSDVCNGGTCGQACASTGDSCGSSKDCCGSLECLSGRCASGPTCSPAGSACSADSDCCGGACTEGECVAPATITFDVSDVCSDGDIVQYRFIDGAASWYWPSPTTAYDISYGQTNQVQVECVPGEQVCIGADQPNSTFYWGIGIDGNYQCSAGVPCCWTCQTGTASYTFSCGGGQ